MPDPETAPAQPPMIPPEATVAALCLRGRHFTGPQPTGMPIDHVIGETERMCGPGQPPMPAMS